MSHTPEVQTLIALVRDDEKPMLAAWRALVGADGGALFPLDFLAHGAIKRNLSTSSAIVLLVEHFNLLAARSMLRIHIDTALRFSAAWFVIDPHVFATDVHRGTRIDKLKDRNGVRLTDARLVELHTPRYPWLPRVYESLSGFVHFSGSHVAATIGALDAESGTFSLKVSKSDDDYPPGSWMEVLRCAHEATELLASYVLGYVKTKAMSPDELAAMRRDA